jgi:hypothetical protein
MEKNKLNRLIEIIREQMVTGSSAGAAGFSGSADPKGPTAGFDPVMGLTRRKKYASLGIGSRKRWMKKKPPQ